MGGDLLAAISRRQEIYDVRNLTIKLYYNEEISVYWSAVAACFITNFSVVVCVWAPLNFRGTIDELN